MYNKNVYKYDDMKRREHMAVRESVGWYYWTHQLMEVTGKDAAVFLDLLFANPIANLKVGRERYTTMLDETGAILDDVVIFRLAEEKFWISTLFIKKLALWLDAHKGAWDVFCKNVTKEYDMYAVQGPKSKEMINAMTKTPVDELKFFSFAPNEIDGIPVCINRAGFTGEKWGYEIYVAPAQEKELEEKLRACAEQFGGREVTDFQVMAWTLPTEKGFYYMRDLMHTNPIETGLDKGINWEKEFIGKEALLKIKESGPAREMVGFTMKEADVRIQGKDLGGSGAPVILDGEEIGRVSKFNYSYVLEKPIGYILVQKGSVAPGDFVKINGHDAEICGTVFI